MVGSNPTLLSTTPHFFSSTALFSHAHTHFFTRPPLFFRFFSHAFAFFDHTNSPPRKFSHHGRHFFYPHHLARLYRRTSLYRLYRRTSLYCRSPSFFLALRYWFSPIRSLFFGGGYWLTPIRHPCALWQAIRALGAAMCSLRCAHTPTLFFAAYARWAYGAGYGYVLTSLRAYAYAAVLCARATPLRAYARLFLRTKPISAAPAHPFPRRYR